MSEECPPPAKRQHLDSDESSLVSAPSDAPPPSHVLIERLKIVLQCSVCRDLPHPDDIYQCPWGHIMCETCAMHLLADATLRRRSARCPHCRRPLQYKDITRNLPLMQALSELPTECSMCKQSYEFKNIERHALYDCQQRLVSCKYACIGCPWQGAHEAQVRHEAECEFPGKSARDILVAVQAKDKRERLDNRGVVQVYNQLSALRVFSIDIEFHLQNGNNADRVLFESHRFVAFSNSWLMRVRINEGALSATSYNERKMSFSLVLMSTPKTALQLHFFLTKSPREQLNIGVHVHKHIFNSMRQSCGYKKMRLADDKECNRMLARKTLWVRLWMFLD